MPRPEPKTSPSVRPRPNVSEFRCDGGNVDVEVEAGIEEGESH